MTRVLIVNDKPENEPERLASLRSYDVLDTAPESVFDDFTDLAAHICEAPIALISLVDENRLWFKSRVGLSVAEIARNLTFCENAIHQPDLFIVPDATQDARFADNALVMSDPHVRFYAGAPLITSDGHALGTLCVIDRVPREMSAEHQQALRLLSRHVMTQLELRRRSLELAQAQAERNEALAMLRREQAATERKGAEEERRKIFERITDAFVALDKNWRYTYVNTKAAEMFGRSADDLIGKHIWTEFPEDAGQKFHLAYEKAMADQQPVFLEDFYPPFNRWFENRIYPSPEGLTIYFHDITERKRNEAALLVSEERYRDLVESTHDLIQSVALDGHFAFANRVWLRTLGYTPEELPHLTIADVITTESLAHCQQLFARVMAGESVAGVEAEFMTKDGRKIFVEGSASPLLREGRVTATNGFFRDVTERKQAESERDRSLESERLARQVTETLSAANLALTHDLNLDTVLETLLEFLGQLVPFDSANVMLLENETRLAVRTVRGYEGFTDRSQTQAIYFDTRNSSVFSPILDQKQSLVIPDTRDFAGWERPAGAEHVISWMGVPLMAGGKIIGLYSMDKTTAGFFTEEHRQLAESLAGQAAVAIQNALLIEEVRQYAAELELRVFQRTAQLTVANKELESFSYSVSHDLRAPLRAVSGFAEIIARRHRAVLNDEGRHYVDNIVKASGRMGNLIDDLLTYSRLGRSGVRSEPVALAGLIGEIGGYLQSRVEEIHGTFKIVDGLPTVMGDHTLLSQLFTNLLENGITYKRPDVPPQVEVAYQLEGENVIVTVSDNGIGIPEEYYEKIFNIFQRLHGDEEYPGTGIGLATVKKSVELLGGSIWVESVVGKGSTFRVRLRRSDV